MRTDPGPSIQRTFAVTIPVIVAIWFVAVPTVLSMSSFFALAGLMVAVVWVGNFSYGNCQPVASVGPLPAERSASREHTRDRR